MKGMKRRSSKTCAYMFKLPKAALGVYFVQTPSEK